MSNDTHSSDRATRYRNLSVAWSGAMALLEASLGRWGSAVAQSFVGLMSYVVVTKVIQAERRRRSKTPLGPRILRRKSGYFCIALQHQERWFEPVKTHCGECVEVPVEAPGAAPTCLACIANYGNSFTR